MTTRRDFLKLTATAALLGVADHSAPAAVLAARPVQGADDRAAACALTIKLADPVLGALARRQLRATMPVESAPGITDRPQFSHLEALARTLTGLAPWLELGPDASEEGIQRGRLASVAREAIDAATDPRSPDSY